MNMGVFCVVRCSIETISSSFSCFTVGVYGVRNGDFSLSFLPWQKLLNHMKCFLDPLIGDTNVQFLCIFLMFLAN